MSDLVLSSGQQEALSMIGRFRAQDEYLVGRVTGYAGTGKTTLIREIAETDRDLVVLTPTGKAALRVGEATGIFAMTIHRFLYTPVEDPRTGKVEFKLKETWDDVMTDMVGKLVLVDEASMVDRDLWADLVKVAGRVGFHVLLMGDLFQLPPVHKDEAGRNFSTLTIETPFSVNLTEVIRQALDSPIIRASMLLRSGSPEYEALEILEPLGQDVLIPNLINARERGGAAICFTNDRRHTLNSQVREALGLEPDTLRVSEPILVTQNNYQLNCWNGEVLDFGGWSREPVGRSSEVVVLDRYTSSSMEMHFGIGRVNLQEAVMAPEQFTGKSAKQSVGGWAIKKQARRWYKDTFYAEQAPPYLDCNYGYALTCHKAQGSEWPETIVVIEDRRAKTLVRYCYVQE